MNATNEATTGTMNGPTVRSTATATRRSASPAAAPLHRSVVLGALAGLLGTMAWAPSAASSAAAHPPPLPAPSAATPSAAAVPAPADLAGRWQGTVTVGGWIEGVVGR